MLPRRSVPVAAALRSGTSPLSVFAAGKFMMLTVSECHHWLTMEISGFAQQNCIWRLLACAQTPELNGRKTVDIFIQWFALRLFRCLDPSSLTYHALSEDNSKPESPAFPSFLLRTTTLANSAEMIPEATQLNMETQIKQFILFMKIFTWLSSDLPIQSLIISTAIMVHPQNTISAKTHSVLGLSVVQPGKNCIFCLLWLRWGRILAAYFPKGEAGSSCNVGFNKIDFLFHSCKFDNSFNYTSHQSSSSHGNKRQSSQVPSLWKRFSPERCPWRSPTCAHRREASQLPSLWEGIHL